MFIAHKKAKKDIYCIWKNKKKLKKLIFSWKMLKYPGLESSIKIDTSFEFSRSRSIFKMTFTEKNFDKKVYTWCTNTNTLFNHVLILPWWVPDDSELTFPFRQCRQYDHILMNNNRIAQLLRKSRCWDKFAPNKLCLVKNVLYL